VRDLRPELWKLRPEFASEVAPALVSSHRTPRDPHYPLLFERQLLVTQAFTWLSGLGSQVVQVYDMSLLVDFLAAEFPSSRAVFITNFLDSDYLQTNCFYGE
jgi:hypothetical protein